MAAQSASGRADANVLTAERCVVTRARPPRLEVGLEKRHGERAALLGIGRAADLVDQRERARAGLPRGSRPASPSTRRRSNGPRGSPGRRRSRCGSSERPAGACPAPAGIGMPHWVSIEKSPAVFSTTVFPPALGPETTRRRRSAAPARKSSGTASRPSRALPSTRRAERLEPRVESGWRAPRRASSAPSSEISGRRPSAISPKATLASRASRAASSLRPRPEAPRPPRGPRGRTPGAADRPRAAPRRRAAPGRCWPR